jgi:hypothetical protein
MTLFPQPGLSIYAPIGVARQALASLLVVQGPATSRFEIDKKAPGAEFLAQKLDAKQFTGVVDAVALCCFQIESHFPAGGPNIKLGESLTTRANWMFDPRRMWG